MAARRTTAYVPSSASGTNWTNPTNVYASDNARAAYANAGQNDLIATGFGFNIPSTATIVGITVFVEGNGASATAANRSVDVGLTKNGSALAGSRAGSQNLPQTTDSILTFGGDASLFGTTWSPSDINSANFGVMLRAGNTNTSQRNIDQIRVDVTYILPTDQWYDDFDDNSIAADKWANWGGAQVVEQNQRLELSSTLAAAYFGVDSQDQMNLVGSNFSVEVVDAGNQALTSWEFYPVQFYVDANNIVGFLITGGNIYGFKKVAGSTTLGTGQTWNGTTYRYLRIREASGTTYWEYSSDRLSWNTFRSESNPITLTSGIIEFVCGTWQAEGSTTTGKVDNLNIDPVNSDRTRFYLPSSGASDIRPSFHSEWNKTSDADRLQMSGYKTSTAITSKTATENVTTSPYRFLNRQYISKPLAAQTISGVVKGQIRQSEDNAAADFLAAVIIKVVSADGNTVRGTLLKYIPSVLARGTEPGTSLTNAYIPPTLLMSSVTAQAGDRIVVEIGCISFNTSSTTRTQTLSFGDNQSTDNIQDEAATTGNNAWLEFKQNIKFLVALTDGGDELDQQNLVGGTGIGWGDSTRHARSQGFIPTKAWLTAIAFKLNSVGSMGLKVYIDNADTNSIPTHTYQSGALYAFTIPNNQLTTNLTKYNLPVPLAVTPGNRYVFYMEPWNTGSNQYQDDYRDWDSSVGNPYSSGKQAQYDPTGGGWTNNDSGNADSVFQTYGTDSIPTGVDTIAIKNKLTQSDTGSGADAITEMIRMTISENGSGADSMTVTPTAILKAITDSGSGSDVLAILTRLSLLDTGAGADVLSMLIRASVADTGSGADAISIFIRKLVQDSGTGTDAIASILNRILQTDSGAGTDTVSELVRLLVADTASGNDTIAVLVRTLLADALLGSDQLTILRKANLQDSGSSSETTAIGVKASIADTGSGNDVASILARVLQQDSGMASEAITVLARILQSDSGVATDAATILARVLLADSGTGVDEATGLETGDVKHINDSGSATDTPTVSAKVPISDSGVGADIIASLIAKFTLTDSGVADDIIAILSRVSVAETGSGTEVAKVLARIGLADSGAGDELIAAFVRFAIQETASGSDTVSVIQTGNAITLQDSGTANDLVSVLARVKQIDIAIGDDVITITRRGLGARVRTGRMEFKINKGARTVQRTEEQINDLDPKTQRMEN